MEPTDADILISLLRGGQRSFTVNDLGKRDEISPEEDFERFLQSVMNSIGYKIISCQDRNTFEVGLISDYPNDYTISSPYRVNEVRHAKKAFDEFGYPMNKFLRSMGSPEERYEILRSNTYDPQQLLRKKKYDEVRFVLYDPRLKFKEYWNQELITSACIRDNLQELTIIRDHPDYDPTVDNNIAIYIWQQTATEALV